MNTQEKEIKKLIKEEEELVKEVKKFEKGLWITTGLIALAIVAVAGGLIYWRLTSNQIFIENSDIEAPSIALAPTVPGTLEEVYVHEGDEVLANVPVARVGTELIKSKVAGEVINVENNIGEQINSGQAVVTMIDPTELRVVGKVDEDKGLSDIRVGNSVTFTVDAFGGKQFSGVVDEISPTSAQSGIVFNISDKREVRQFFIKARFDINQYNLLKNGMSARMWVYTK
ncbi:MAG: HlyD family efflux transporter periplasmic adaptor subunit [bacterium]